MICIKCGRDDAPALIAGKCMKCAEVAPVTGPVLKELRGHHPSEVNAARAKNRIRKARRNGTLIKRRCIWCNAKFSTERNDKLYCCEKHKDLHSDARQGERRRKERMTKK